MPQFGWQPHLSEPHSALEAAEQVRQVARTGPSAESGNQSRIGSPMPACVFTSCARWESV